MRILFTLAITLIVSISATVATQVDFYFFHIPNQKHVKNYEIGTGYLYNRTGVTIDVKLEAKVFNKNEELVYHILTKTHSIAPGKTVISNVHYKNATPLVNKLNPAEPLLNHRIQTQLLHPIDLQSIIANYDVFTKNYIRSSAPEDRYNYFYIIPAEIELNSRGQDFFDEGTKLTHHVKIPPKAPDYHSSDFTIDISRSKLLSMKDNLGNEYLDHEFTIMRDRSEYQMNKAKQGHFMASSTPDHEVKNLDIPFMGNRSELATFYTRTFSLPAMATNITSEGYITIIEHTDELVTETIEVELFDGQRTKISGMNIDWAVNGVGGCGMGGPDGVKGGSYELIIPKTALKIESIVIKNPMIDFCPDSPSNTWVQIDETRLPYKAQLEIVYHKPIAKEVYFKNEFNLSLDPNEIKPATDHNRDAGISKLVISKKKEKSQILVEFPILESSNEINLNTSSSSVTLKDELGNTIDLGLVTIKDNYFVTNDKFTLEIESVPPIGTKYLVAEVELAFDKMVEGTDKFVMKVGSTEQAEIKIDNYLITFAEWKKMGNRTYTLTPKNSNFCCGIPGRKIISIKIFDDQNIEIGESTDLSSVSIPDDDKIYELVIEAQKKTTYYESISKKIALGAMISPAN